MPLRRILAFVLTAGLVLTGSAALAAVPPVESPWYEVDDDGEVTIDLYFVWSETCPHCQHAKPLIEALPDELPWLRLHSWTVSDEENVDRAVALAESVGRSIEAVPAFLLCEQVLVGYDGPEGRGQQIVDLAEACRDAVAASVTPTPGSTTTTTLPDEAVEVPVIGDVDADASLPLVTVAIAALDAFNPCAFFVLLFLLSLLVHARSRARMAAIGGIFVLVSGVVYFIFMAAWLNIFDLVGEIEAITVVAGLVAMVIAAINIKDYFARGRGPSLSIPEAAKPGLFKRMRALTAGASVPALAVGAVTLAVAANSYEVLCTAGFPMAFTRILTLNDLSTATYYEYLVLYNLVYIVPLLLIVGGFVWGFGSRKLREEEGMILKLLSGTMMFGLGLVLVFAPGELSEVGTAVALLGLATAATGVTVAARRLHHRGHGQPA